jgi:hypothetical protein
MARQFLTSLNLKQNELQNAVIQHATDNPLSGVEGQIYYNTTAHEIRVYNGTEWEAVGLNGVTSSAAEINILDGATLTTTELNTLTGITANVNELNILDGATLDVNELNTLDGITATTAELNTLDGITATVSELNILDGATLDVNELNILDGATVTFSELNILDGATLSTTELNYVDGVTSGIQGQLDLKAPIAGPVFTGIVTVATSIAFEGDTPDNNETTLKVADPTTDRTIILPDNSGTVILNSNTINELTAPAADFSMNGQKITNVGTPSADTDAANKAYVDAARSGLDVKQSVRVASTPADGNVDLTGGTPTTSLDGTTLPDGDRVLLKDQADATENGIYVYDSADNSFTRATDADEPAELNAGTFFFVEKGSVNGDAGFVVTSDNPIVIGTDPLVFTQFSGTGQIVAGGGITKTGNQLDVIGTADRITVNADSVDIASTYVGQTSITTVGSIGTGTWEATDVAVAHGGTGASTAVDARANLGATTKYTAANTSITPAGGTATWTVTHNLGIRSVVVQMYTLDTYETVEVDVLRTNTSTVTLSWVASATVSADTYQVVIVG